MSGTDIPEGHTTGCEFTIVCCHCQQVRTADGRWESRDVLPGERVSHGICLACFVRHYPEVPLPPSIR